jgi:hypothetical protein
MDNKKPATEPDVLASPRGNIDVAPRSATPTDRHGGVWRILRSPMFGFLAGIVAPIACLAVQPVLLPGEPLNLPGLWLIGTFWLFGYGVIGLEMLFLALRLAFGTHLGTWNGPVAGVLFVGALFAGGLGLVLPPSP